MIKIEDLIQTYTDKIMTKYISMIKRTLVLALVLMGTIGGKLQAQQQAGTISGRVTDAFGKPLAGVAIIAENGRQGTATDAAGKYTITLTDESQYLVFSYLGYASKQQAIGSDSALDVALQADAHRKDQLVELGYTAQPARDVSGSVSTVTGEQLEKAPVANLSQSLAGRLAGLTTQETFSELSRANTDLFVRGLSAARSTDPLVVVDGLPISYNSNQTLEYISANEIESVTLLKDASTQALYGIQGANGVLVVTTKRGRKGPLRVKTRLDQSFQEVTTQPAVYASADYALLRNQAAVNDGREPNYFFSDEQIAQYRSGTNEMYPSNNWYKRYIKDYASMQRMGVNVTGGDDKVQFFSNINFMHQGGQFRTEQTKYDPNARNIWVNYRSNVDMNLNKSLKGFVRLSGNIKREHTPGAGNEAVYRSIFQLPPTMYGPLTPLPNNDSPKGEKQVVTTDRVTSPTFGMLNRTGYVNHTVTNITSQFGLTQDLDFLTKGLNLTGSFAYQTNSVGSLRTTQDYERWVRTNDADALTFVKKGSQVNSPLAYGKSHSYYYHLSYNAALNYQRDFDKHRIGGMGYFFYQNLTKADTGSPWLLPYNRLHTGAEATYGYDNRYLLKLDAGYSGSEQYARGSRYTLTPAVSGAWVVSNEGFAQADWLSNLKLRASYGKTANDQSGLARFAYLDNVTATGGGPLAYLQYMINERQVGNPNIQAEVSVKKNAGLDIGLFNALTVSVDVFRERMDNMVVSAFATIPLYQGIPLQNYPRINAGQFENKGYEITAHYTKRFTPDLSVFGGGMFSYAKNTIIDWNEAQRTEDYAYRNWQEGYSFGQEFGYLVDYSNGNGFFNTQTELDNSTLEYSFGQPRLGDLKYRDLNEDQKIDERDKAPIGIGALPRTTFALSGGLTFKSFDVSLLLQGIGNYSSILSGTGVWETDFDGVFGALHRNAWTPERYEKGEEITSPALSLVKSVNHEASDYYSYDRSYVRLKNLELGYTLPASLTRAARAEKVRFLLSGQNLLTWDKMKSDDFGPEGGGYSGFPVYRVYNLGVSLEF
jgi:TonB-linked SusC/RagA family outer membrane protein